MVQTQAFWRQDIANVLRAVQRANLPLTRAGNPSAQAYCAGFNAALVAVGLAFDIALDAPAVAPGDRLPLGVEREWGAG
jgi:hypothetical protein